MTLIEILQEFWLVIIILIAVCCAGVFILMKVRKSGVKSLGFIGQETIEIAEILGGIDRPNDKIAIYKLIDNKTKNVSWCLNVTTKSRKFHGTGRIAGEIPLFFDQESLKNIIGTFAGHRF